MAEKLEILITADDQTKSVLGSVRDGLSDVGKVAIAGLASGLAVGIAAVGAAAVQGISSLQSWAGTVDAIGDVLGTTAGEGVALGVAIRGVGGDVTAITGQMAFLTRGLTNTKGEIGPTGAVLKDLGINFQDANGRMRPSTEILTDIANKLASMPDGLEKTALMTDLFGKSGKDLADVMAALANDGLEKAREKAEAFGLSLSEETLGSSIEFGKQMENLKMAGEGFFVTIGSQLLPILLPLAERLTQLAMEVMPQVRAGIEDAAEWVTGTFVPAVQDILVTMQPVLDWIVGNWQPLLIGVFAALTVAVGAFVYTTVIPAAVATITALAPIILPLLAIAAVVALLAAAWQRDWGGIRTTLTSVWESSLRPTFEVLRAWLAENIPIAIERLRNFWETVLLPAMQTVWSFLQTSIFPIFATLGQWLSAILTAYIQTLANYWNTVLLPALNAIWEFTRVNLIPLLTALGELVGVVLKLAVTVLAGVWQNILRPALVAIYEFIRDNVAPIIADLVDVISDRLSPVVKTIAAFLGENLAGAFRGISNAIQGVIGWINDLIDALKRVQLPDFLTPGSPTPFELGIRGVSDAMRDLNRDQLPALVAQLSGSGRGGNVNNFNQVVYTNGQADQVLSEFNSLRSWWGRGS